MDFSCFPDPVGLDKDRDNDKGHPRPSRQEHGQVKDDENLGIIISFCHECKCK